MNNYPPGVTGNEPQITGQDDPEWDTNIRVILEEDCSLGEKEIESIMDLIHEKIMIKSLDKQNPTVIFSPVKRKKAKHGK